MLTDPNGGNRSTVTISAKYVPVPIQLEMRETVNSGYKFFRSFVDSLTFDGI